jgi:hypothetical protein
MSASSGASRIVTFVPGLIVIEILGKLMTWANTITMATQMRVHNIANERAEPIDQLTSQSCGNQVSSVTNI